MEETAGLLVELAMVVTREKLLLEECLELFRMISALEVRNICFSSFHGYIFVCVYIYVIY